MKKSNIIDIESVTIESPHRSLDLSKMKVEKISQVNGAGNNSGSPFYSETKRSKNLLNEKISK